MSLKTPVLGKSETECHYHPFLSVKEGKNVLDAKNNNFHFFAFLKSFSVCKGPLGIVTY